MQWQGEIIFMLSKIVSSWFRNLFQTGVWHHCAGANYTSIRSRKTADPNWRQTWVKQRLQFRASKSSTDLDPRLKRQIAVVHQTMFGWNFAHFRVNPTGNSTYDWIKTLILQRKISLVLKKDYYFWFVRQKGRVLQDDTCLFWKD